MSVINSIDEWNIASEKWRGRREPSPTKTAATFTLAQLEQLSEEYVSRYKDDHVNTRRLVLSGFLWWLRNEKIKENPNG